MIKVILPSSPSPPLLRAPKPLDVVKVRLPSGNTYVVLVRTGLALNLTFLGTVLAIVDQPSKDAFNLGEASDFGCMAIVEHYDATLTLKRETS